MLFYPVSFRWFGCLELLVLKEGGGFLMDLDLGEF